MSNTLICIGIIALAELLSIGIFKLLSRFNSTRENDVTFRSVFKGMAERAFITFALWSNIPQALTVFAALKIATRIKDESKISNDFYLLGNLLSIVMAIGYTYLLGYYFRQLPL